MSTMNWRGMLWAGLALTFSWPSLAADVTTFDSCVDATGRTLAAEVDKQQPMLVRTVLVDGQPAIRYNPAVLPRLTLEARLFFYAHQCARPATGDVSKPLSVAAARQADCSGLNTLLTSAMLSSDDLPALQTEMGFTEAEWQLLPGPARNIDVTSCRVTGGLRLPSVHAAEPHPGWNACVRACADRLWTCQKRCGGGECTGCLDTHRQCRAGCGGTDKPAD